MPRQQFRRRKMPGRSKFVTKRSLPFLLSKISEAKQININFTNVLVKSPAVAATNQKSLTLIDQGDGKANREGNMIQVTGYYISATINSNATSVSQYCRVIVYTPRKIGTTLLPSDTMTTQPDTDKFIIWDDRVVVPSFQQGGGLGLIQFKQRWKPYMKVIYDSSAADSVTQGEILVLVLSHENDGVLFNAQCRLFFRDI